MFKNKLFSSLFNNNLYKKQSFLSTSTLKYKDKIKEILTKEDTKEVLKILYQNKDKYWACDTETINIDIKTQGPVGNGKVICMSIYGGPDVDFGDGPGSVLWIENINKSNNLLQEFKPWLENSTYKKVWHNYGFDRHVLYNEGINCLGFGGYLFILIIIVIIIIIII